MKTATFEYPPCDYLPALPQEDHRAKPQLVSALQPAGQPVGCTGSLNCHLFNSSVKPLQELTGRAAVGMADTRADTSDIRCSCQWSSVARKPALPQMWLSSFPGVSESFDIT